MRFSKRASSRIIPTRVGTSAFLRSEYTASTGSSPRVWGQVDGSIYRVALSGIIPTRVGTSYLQPLLHCLLGDHPHACGDKCTDEYTSADYIGSSPRVWGQEVRQCNNNSCLRIIPTRVGTSRDNIAVFALTRDHPHACGDKFCRATSAPTEVGSSPRVWGQERERAVCIVADRIIPTRVGTR